jgi:hypothetical protein
MLESIISPETAERSPWDMIFLGIVIASLGIWLGHYLGVLMGAPVSMVSLAIIVMALAPLIHRLLVVEEKREELACHKCIFGFITRHTDVIAVYSFLFLGLFIAFTTWYVFLPYESDVMPCSSEMFSVQESAISSLQKQVSATGAAVGVQEMVLAKPYSTLSANDLAELEQIRGMCNPNLPKADPEVCLSSWRSRFNNLISNNLWVMLFAFAASFMFGAGALWILTWNASTIGVHVGMQINKMVFATGSTFDAYLMGLPYYSLGMLPWALPEVLAYLVAAIAGGIISVAVSRHHFRSEKFWLVVFDGIFFLLIALFLIVVGAYVEHFFLPVPCPNI